MKHTLALTGILATLTLPACGDSAASEPYDTATLEQYLTALPSEDRLRASVPEAEASRQAQTLLGNAELAHEARKAAFAINLPALTMVRLLRTIAHVPPTRYDDEDNAFVWGPWSNDEDDGYGQVLVYIKRNPAGEDFEYSYAFARLENDDPATITPVIWGAATPDPTFEDRGVGVTLWDFEANNAWEADHDPAFDPDARRTEGRFSMLYGHGEEDEGEFVFNVAAFRDFIAEDSEEESPEPADLDYFFGRFYGSDGNRVDFLDWRLSADLCDDAVTSCFDNDVVRDAAETFDLRAAFYNGGVGRAEALVHDGDLRSESVSAVECWDESLNRTYFDFQAGQAMAELGACAAPLDQPLSDLGIPTLGEVDAEILEALACVSENGLGACE
jgi:hypothetical protein